MFRRGLTHIAMIWFAVAFLVPRIANLHALSHLSEDEDTPISCELCVFVMQSDQFDLINTNSSYSEVELHSVPSTLVVLQHYHTPKEKIASPNYIYNKPPPLL